MNRVWSRSRPGIRWLVGLLALTITACSAPTAPQTAPPASQTTSPGTSDATKPAAPQAPQVKRGGRLQVPDGSGYPHLDFSQIIAGGSITTVYERLLTHRGNNYNDFELVPNLATEWTVSDGGKTVTLKLRQGVKWHKKPPVNGREFTSEDVKWNAEYYPTKSNFKFLFAGIEKIETPDKYTVIFRLKEPIASFVINLANTQAFMLPREVFEKDGHFKNTAIGTGPFMIRDYEPKVKMILDRNPNYWKVSEIDGKPLPYLDGIDEYTVTDGNSRMAGYRSGTYDIAYAAEWLAPSQAAELRKLGMTIIEGYPDITRDLLINRESPIWQDINVRRAASLAIDRDLFIKNQYEGEGYYQDFVPAAGWGWDEATKKRKFAPDLAKARQLLTAAGKGGMTIRFKGYRTTTAGLNPQAVQLVADMLQQVGFKTELSLSPDFPSFRDSVIVKKDWDAMLLTHGRGADDPDGYLGRMTCSTPVTTNYGNICDPKLDEMIKVSQREMDPARRKQLVGQIQDYLYDNLLLIPLAVPKVFKVVNSRVKGPNILHGSQILVNIEQTWIDK